jgi:hypothetical protein
VARRFGVSLFMVQFWLRRAANRPLDQVDWRDRASGPRCSPRRTPPALEERILRLRRELREDSDLGEYGAAAIRRALVGRAGARVPQVRTIHRVLERRGALDAARRLRHPPPPRGWYLPPVAARHAELDQFDRVEGLKIKAGPLVEVLNGVSLHGGLVEAWPQAGMTAEFVRNCLVAHWRKWGLPAYAQFDNDTVFQGPHQHPDAIGSVLRLCLSLGVVPVFVPPRETGFQAAIENFNGQWQAKVWTRFVHASLAALRRQSAKYVAAHRQRSQARRDGAPERRPFPPDWQLNLQAPPHGQLVFVRRTGDQGQAHLLGRTFKVAETWPHRLVRCEVRPEEQSICFFGLRRRAPHAQPLLRRTPYAFPTRRFRE